MKTKTKYDKMIQKMRDVVNNFDYTTTKNPKLKDFYLSFFNDPFLFEFHREGFSTGYGASKHHHAYQGGLLDHTLSIIDAGIHLHASVYDFHLPRFVFAAYYHDIGKTITYTSEGKTNDLYYRVGHIPESFRIFLHDLSSISERNFDEENEIIHCILSHHGPVSNGWGSSVDPKTKEALLLHHVDMIDSKFFGELLDKPKFL